MSHFTSKTPCVTMDFMETVVRVLYDTHVAEHKSFCTLPTSRSNSRCCVSMINREDFPKAFRIVAKTKCLFF